MSRAAFEISLFSISPETIKMSLLKRNFLDDDLRRRIRARRESSGELDSVGSEASTNGGELHEISEESQSEADDDGVGLLGPDGETY